MGTIIKRWLGAGLAFLLLFTLSLQETVVFAAPLESYRAEGSPALLSSQEETSEQAERTILLYMCGSNLETEAALATLNLKQVLGAKFSRENKVHVVVMTGGAEYWWLDEDDCVIPEGMMPNYFDDTEYNRIWEAFGSDKANESMRSKLVLLDGDGITGDGENAKEAWDELMSDPKTLRAFINFGAERYPAKKYDLILWDHGGGPVDGFAVDDYCRELDTMSLPEILDALSDNQVTAKGGKFDLIDFDACLMNSAELNLALADYTDYYIASAETEPGYGQDYRGWLNMLGEAPEMSVRAFGMKLVEDFIAFYKDKNGNETDYGTLALVDTSKLINSGFADAVSELADVLRAQINTQDAQNDYMYYDELDAAKRSIQYGKPDTYYRDLGNLASLLAVTNKEVSAKSIGEGGYTKLNDYAGVSAKIQSILNDPNIIYSKYSESLVSEEPVVLMDENQELQYKKLKPSGMYIYLPAVRDSDYALEYLESVTASLPYIKNEKSRNALQNYAKTAAQYALMADIGFYISFLYEIGTPLDEINYDYLKEYLEDSYPEGAETEWEKRILKMAGYITESQEEAEQWIRGIIRQQTSDFIQPENITIDSNPDKNSFRIEIKNTAKRAIEAVKAKVIAELPAVQAYLEDAPDDDYSRGYLAYLYSRYPERFDCSIRTVYGIRDTGDLGIDYAVDSLDTILEKYRDWYLKDGSVWYLEDNDQTVQAVEDAEGKYHAVKTEPLSKKQIMAYMMYPDPNKKDGTMKNGYLVFEPDGDDWVLSKISLTGYEGDRLIPVKKLNEPLKGVTMSFSVKISSFYLTLIPMSETAFTVSPDTAGSVKLLTTDISNVPDIRDTNADGNPVSRRIVVSDIYGTECDVSVQIPGGNLVDVKDLSVEPVVYNGGEQGPKLMYNGKVLKEKTDYIWYKSDDTKAYKNAGEYAVELIGRGRYIGRCKTTYSILPKTGTLSVRLSGTAFVCNGKVQKPAVKAVKIGNTVLSPEDYEVTYQNAESKKVGIYTVTVTCKGNYRGSVKKTYRIIPKETTVESPQKEDQAAADIVAELLCTIPEDVTTAAKEQVDAARKAYDALTPAQKALVDPKLADRLERAEAYIASVCKYNDKVKKARVKKVNIKSARAKKGRKALITWKKQTGISGYQIVYSTSKKFTGKTTKKVYVSRKTTGKNLNKLKAGKRYYVKVRTCTLVKNPTTGKNERIYGRKYSKVKRFRAKK